MKFPPTDFRFLATPATSRSGAQNLAALLIVLVVLFLTFSSPRFLTVGNVENLVVQIAPLLLAALGQTVVILTGGLDVSVGAVIGLTTAIVSLPMSAWVTAPLALVAAALVGAWNGLLVHRLKIHPIVVTLASSTMVSGVALLVRPTPGGSVPQVLITLVNGRFLGLPIALYWIVLFVGLGIWMLQRTRFGLHLVSVGGSASNARLAGIKVGRIVVGSYVLSALFAAVSGLFLAGRVSSGDALIGLPFTLDSIAAVALGGTQFTGGIGGMAGTLFGSVLLGLLSNGMNLLNVSPFLQSILNGLLLLLAVSFSRRKRYGI